MYLKFAVIRLYGYIRSYDVLHVTLKYLRQHYDNKAQYIYIYLHRAEWKALGLGFSSAAVVAAAWRAGAAVLQTGGTS